MRRQWIKFMIRVQFQNHPHLQKEAIVEADAENAHFQPSAWESWGFN